MRLVTLLICLITLTGCSLPKVSAKRDWLTSIGSFGFVPLYPMREDIHVGDLRIHRIDISDNSLNSRPLDPLKGIFESKEERDKLLKRTKMALPRIDVTRTTDANFEASGLIGLWNSVFGVTYNRTEVLSVALTDLETEELEDHRLIEKFEDQVILMLSNEIKLKALCVAAKVMGDPKFKDTAISVVTRVGYANGIEYRRSRSGTLTVDGSTENAGTKTKASAKNSGTASGSGQSITAKFGTPLAFGVDAIMIDPKKLGDIDYGRTKSGAKKNLAQYCKDVTQPYVVSPLSNVITGARKRL